MIDIDAIDARGLTDFDRGFTGKLLTSTEWHYVHRELKELRDKSGRLELRVRIGEGLLDAAYEYLMLARAEVAEPIPMLLDCPSCHKPHVDRGEWATMRLHRTHRCEHCGRDWRPSHRLTVGVQMLEDAAVAGKAGGE